MDNFCYLLINNVDKFILVNTKMKILFITPRFHTNMTEWIKVLISKGHSVHINSLIQHEVEDHSLIKPVLFKLSPLSKLILYLFGDGGENLKRGFPGVISYFYYLYLLKPKIVIVRDLSRSFSILAILISRIINIKIIVYSQSRIYEDKSVIKIVFFHLLSFFFNAAYMSPIIGTKKNEHKKIKNSYYVPFAVSKREFFEKSKKNFKILAIGKFVERKRHLELIEVFKSLVEEHQNVYLTIIGEAYKEDHFKRVIIIHKLIKKLNLENKVKVYLNIPFEDMSHYYRKNNLFVLPSSDEPASISILEALSYGLPVICSETCGTSEYIDEGINGLVFKDRDFLDLKKKLIKIVSKKNLCNQKNIYDNFKYQGDYFYSHFTSMIKDKFKISLND